MFAEEQCNPSFDTACLTVSSSHKQTCSMPEVEQLQKHMFKLY